MKISLLINRMEAKRRQLTLMRKLRCIDLGRTSLITSPPVRWVGNSALHAPKSKLQTPNSTLTQHTLLQSTCMSWYVVKCFSLCKVSENWTKKHNYHTLNSKIQAQHSTLPIPHFTLNTLHFSPYTPHSTLYAPHSTLHILHSKLYSPHTTPHTSHSKKLYTPHCTLHTQHYTLCLPQSSLNTLRSTLHTPHFTLKIYTPHSTLSTLHYTLCPPHFTLNNPHSTLSTPHSALYTLSSKIYSPHQRHTRHYTPSNNNRAITYKFILQFISVFFVDWTYSQINLNYRLNHRKLTIYATS